MKKLSTIIMALALVLGMSQCKKQETPTSATPNANPGVHITVNVGDQDGKDNNGERHNIAPQYGLFAFSNNDTLYVGHNGKYVGCLKYTNGFFDGTIYPDDVENQPLHFYFLGGKGPKNPTSSTTTYNINIADQSENLPVLSYGASTKPFTGTGTTYSTTLRNQCALVRFDLQHTGDYEVTLSNVPTLATVNFANPTAETAIVATEGQTNGNITLYGEEGNTAYRWAILLPGTNLDNAEGLTIGSTVEDHEMGYNTYINSGISINNPVALPDPPADEYAVKNSDNVLSQFTVNENGKKVYFSKANLRFVGYTNQEGSWSFHENQVDASCASGKGDNVVITGSTNDRLAWGLYGNHGMYEDDWPAITTNLSKADGNDWGCAFSETSLEGGNWRTLTIAEWNYLFNERNQDIHFLKVAIKLSDDSHALDAVVQGILLFPDGYVEPTDLTKDFTDFYDNPAAGGMTGGYVWADGSNWSNSKLYTDQTSNTYKMLAAGAVFLPAAGYRISTYYYDYFCHQVPLYSTDYSLDDIGRGYYWSSTSGAYNEYSHTSRAFYFDRTTVGEASTFQDRSRGMCVRLVWDAN